MRQAVLHQANDHAGQEARNRITSRDGKKDSYQQRQVKIDRKTWEAQRQEGLHKKG